MTSKTHRSRLEQASCLIDNYTVGHLRTAYNHNPFSFSFSHLRDETDAPDVDDDGRLVTAED